MNVIQNETYANLYTYSHLNIIKYPIITDKATRLLVNNKYSFAVNPKADKLSIKAAVEFFFNVKVIKITTSHLPKKKKKSREIFGLEATL